MIYIIVKIRKGDKKNGPECFASACVQSVQKIGKERTGWNRKIRKKIQPCRRSIKEDRLERAPAAAPHGYASRHVWAAADILRCVTAEPQHRLPRKLSESTYAQGPSMLKVTERAPASGEKNTTSR